MNWIQDLMDATLGLESPRVYFRWAGLAALSAVAKRSVWLDRDGAYQLYPNIFVILVGRSGLKKGIPVNLAQKLVEKVDNTRIIHGRGSVQGIVKQLAEVKDTENNGPILDACGFFVSGEFASALVEDPVALTMLTDLYDCHYNDDWATYLTGRATDSLKNVSLTLLSASNQVHLRESIPDSAIGGGFVARTFFIVANKRGALNSLIRKTGRKIDKDELSNWLREVSCVEGELNITADGQDYYEAWYNEFHSKDHEDSTGTSERIGDHILKVAMLISLSRRLTRIITKEDIETAVKHCMILEPNINRAMVGQPSKAQLDHQAKVLMEEVLSSTNGCVTRVAILQKRWGEVNAIELDIVAENLQQAKFIKIIGGEGETAYRATDFLLAKFKQVKEEEKEGGE